MARSTFGVVVASAAQTATGASATIVEGGDVLYKGIVMVLHVTAVSGTGPTLVPAIQVQDDATSVFVQAHTTLTGTITAAGDYLIAMYPGMADAVALPGPVRLNGLFGTQNWRVAWTIGGTTPSFTFQVDALYLQ